MECEAVGGGAVLGGILVCLFLEFIAYKVLTSKGYTFKVERNDTPSGTGGSGGGGRDNGPNIHQR